MELEHCYRILELEPGASLDEQLGTGSTADADRPVAVRTKTRFAVLRAGGRHTCGITVDGVLYCWGQNAFGQLGHASAQWCSRIPCGKVPRRARLRAPVARVTTGLFATCAIGGGVQVCWGPNDSGQRGTGVVRASDAWLARTLDATDRPAPLQSLLSRVLSVARAAMERFGDRVQSALPAAAGRAVGE